MMSWRPSPTRRTVSQVSGHRAKKNPASAARTFFRRSLMGAVVRETKLVGMQKFVRFGFALSLLQPVGFFDVTKARAHADGVGMFLPDCASHNLYERAPERIEIGSPDAIE